MIERDILLADGRVFRFHEFEESIVDFGTNKIYALTRSKETLESPDYVVLQAVLNFTEWSPDLLGSLPGLIETADLKLFNGIVNAVFETVETLKYTKRKAINTARDLAEKAGFTYMGRPIDSDMQSVNRINTTFSAAMACFILGRPFSVEWTCADNSKLELDAQGMIGMPQALAAYGSVLHNRATYLKDQVEAITSTDIEEVKALLAAIPDS